MMKEAFIIKESLKDATVRRVHLIRIVVVYFDNNKDKDNTTDFIVETEDYKLPKLEDYDVYKNSMQFKARTIRVTDLHLNLKIDDIKALFTKYEMINNCVVQTPKLSLQQNAYITYESPNDIRNFHQVWGHLIFNDYARVYPCSLSKDQVAQRNAYRIKLINLPYNTSARDLTDIIKAVDAKACYIPRSSNYKPKPFAVLFFENADKFNDAVK